MLSAMLRTLDLRDQMTARHSAAVARYSRAIAQRAGFSRREEELVHIAALLHDIGKFILPDRILKANVPLTDEDWMLIRRHPQQGARVVSSLDGYGPVAEIILAHHERIDGKGYPRGLDGDDIPEHGPDHLRRRHLRRDDRARLLPGAGLVVRGDPGAAAGRRNPARRPLRRRSSSSCSRARTSASATARTPTSRRSWRWRRGSRSPRIRGRAATASPAPPGSEPRPAQGPGCGYCVFTKRSHIRSLRIRRWAMIRPAEGVTL